MKKITAMLLAVCLAVTMFGCGSSGSDNTTGSTAESTTPTTKPVTFKSYTVSDEAAAAARSTVIATVNGNELTNGVLNVCYWMGVYSFLNNYGSYASLYGLDYTQPLDKQGPATTDGSWQEFFIEDALLTWHRNQAVALAGKKLDVQMPDDMKNDLDSMLDQLRDAAEENGFESADAMFQKEFGMGCTIDDYYGYQRNYYQYVAVMLYLDDTIEVTQEDIDKYFAENEDDLAKSKITKDSGNVFDVRHILISPEGGTKDDSGKTTYSEAEWEACRKKAQKLMDEWAGGTATEETFSNYAKEYSTDPGSKDDGGLYQDLNKDTSFVEPFKNWYLEEGRKVGDYGLVKTDYGYHIMYMSNIEAQWISYCRSAIIDDTVNKFIDDAKKEFPMESDQNKIMLGEVTLVSNK